MTVQPVEANVVLTADNSQYDQAMDASSQSTAKLGTSVDSLGKKLENLSKSAGRKLLGLTAADVALISGATAAWASYEKQMSRLQAQAAVIGRNRDQETRIMKNYTESVRDLRKEFGTTTEAAASLTQSISKLAGNTQQLKGLASVFEQMSMATGESADGLASSVLNLQKIMGTPITTRATQNYADQLTYLAAKSNTSAAALADFTSQIAPMGRAMGMTQTQVTGFANMFIKAGQDGYTAATAFNKVAQDITYAVQTGNPDLAKYANVLGVTVKQFKDMTGAQQVAGFLDQIAKMGPRAAIELNRFGFDGIRMAKALTATVQASGGATNAIREAQVGYGSDATSQGAKAAENLTTVLAKIRQEMQMTAESFATVLGPGIVIVLEGIEKVAGAFNELMSGPLGKFMQVAAAVLVPIGAITAAMALMAGTIVKAAAAFALFRNSAVLGAKEGLQGGSRIIAETTPSGFRTGGFIAAGGGMLGRRGAQIAEGGTWYQRGIYNVGQTVGGAARGGWMGLRGMQPFVGGAGGGPSLASRGAAGVLRFGSSAFTSQFDQMRFANPAARSQWFGQYFPGQGPQLMQAQGAATQARLNANQAQAVYQSYAGARQMGSAMPVGEAAAKQVAEDTAKVADALEEEEKKILATSIAREKEAAMIASTSKANLGVYATMRAEGANVAKAFAGAAAGATRFAASTAAAGLSRAGSGLLGALGGPWGAALTGLMFAPMLMGALGGMGGERERIRIPRYPTLGTAYTQAAGRTPAEAANVGLTQAQMMQGAAPHAVSIRQARTITQADIQYATSGKYQPGQGGLQGMGRQDLVQYLGALYPDASTNPQSLERMKLDIIHATGNYADANWVMQQLQSGAGKGGAGYFLNKLSPELGTGVGAPTGRAMAIAQYQIGLAQQRGGTAAADRARLGFLSQMYGAGQQLWGPQQDAYRSALESRLGIKLPQGFGGVGAAAPTPLAPSQIGAGLSFGTTATGGGPGPSFAQPAAKPAALPPGARRAVRAAEAKLRAAGFDNDTVQGYSDLFSGVILGQQSPQSVTNLLAAAGVQDTSLRGIAAYRAGMGALAQPPSQGGIPRDAEAFLAQQVRRTGPTGRMFEASGAMQRALSFGGQNTLANVRAINDLMDKMTKAGQSAPQITKSMGDIQSAIGDPTDPRYILAGMVTGQAQQQMAVRMQTMTRGAAFGTQVQAFQAAAAIQPMTDEQVQQRAQAEQQMQGAMVDQINYFKQLLLMQDQYNIQRQRAQEDFALSRDYAEHDYNLQRERATADYYRNVKRAQYDYQLSRQRAEEDFNHSVLVMAEQQAMSIYDIQQRVQVQRTSSATQLLANAGDQLARMRQQEQDLSRVRRMGLSTQAIQQLGLTDPANQQQLARFVTELTPQMIRQFNRTAGSERIKAAKDLVTDQSSLEWREMRRSFNLQMDRGREDFNRGLARQRDDFNLSMDRQADDFTTQMNRQETQYATTMRRGAEDLANVGKEIDGNFEDILTQSVNKLTGHAQAQAQAVLNSFRNLKNDTNPQAIALMQDLASIFGFKYQIPKGISNNAPMSDAGAGAGRQGGTQVEYHTGGVVPGFSPGRDTTTIGVGGGEAIMRPEWTRAVGGRGAVDAMNRAAVRGFAGGGVVWPLPGGQPSTYAGHDGVDLNIPGGDYGKPFYAAAPGKISYVGWGHGYGDAIFETGPYGTVVYGHGSKVAVRAGQVVAAGQYIGNVGSTGNSTGPHLHFGFPGGTYAQAMAFLSGASHAGYGASPPAGAGATLGLLQRLYAGPERAAHAMQGVHPLFPGDISKVLNRYGRQAISRASARYGAPEVVALHLGNQPSEHLDNEHIVHVGATRVGWGNQWSALHSLLMGESGFNNLAQNPTSSAFGMFQFLDSTWPTVGGHKTTDPWLQTKYGLQYIRNAYGDPAHAWAKWQSRTPHWYGNGSLFTSPNVIGVGEGGPEAVIPLNDRGGEFLSNAMARSMSPMRGGGSIYATRIDRSTNFSGPITVQASDPAEMVKKLQARQRVMALTKPVLTGSAA